MLNSFISGFVAPVPQYRGRYATIACRFAYKEVKSRSIEEEEKSEPGVIVTGKFADTKNEKLLHYLSTTTLKNKKQCQQKNNAGSFLKHQKLRIDV